MFFLKNSSFFGFRSLIDILGVDCLGRSDGFRFMVYYVFYNRNLGFSFSLKVFLGLYDLITTSTNLYKAAGWAEREVYDMFGIYFHKNEDMRRILTDYGFVGFPLRKEFPLSGYFELQYSEEYKTVISLPTKLGQAFRKFSPGLNWGGLIN
jgi:NADH-quinone oxidoreductase subunit C